jgi:hypothetical protein
VAPGELRETSALGSGESGEMVMRVLIVYESIYGSNLKIAGAVAAGIGGDAATTIVGAQAAPAAVWDTRMANGRRRGGPATLRGHDDSDLGGPA